MTSNRPYLVRALYEWVTDNDMTPHLLVDATREGVEVPPESVEDGRIVLNISPGAVKHLSLGNDVISFEARFSGSAMTLFIPVVAVLGIYSRENGQGMLFPESTEDSPPTEPTAAPAKSAKPSLKVVK